MQNKAGQSKLYSAESLLTGRVLRSVSECHPCSSLTLDFCGQVPEDDTLLPAPSQEDDRPHGQDRSQQARQERRGLNGCPVICSKTEPVQRLSCTD
ncbi:hypothetical protein EYF80_046056 [Liparis tanakae]|uniref:Uncharacterized protein n=1 Tax=Liparis tanakae TaxID=230148 RepID=A0A4Z2FR72_9TELE|nr:hypothetical protein EYF80_046056 [Liparis tanakae]